MYQATLAKYSPAPGPATLGLHAHQAVRRMRCTPESVATGSLSSPTCACPGRGALQRGGLEHGPTRARRAAHLERIRRVLKRLLHLPRPELAQVAAALGAAAVRLAAGQLRKVRLPAGQLAAEGADLLQRLLLRARARAQAGRGSGAVGRGGGGGAAPACASRSAPSTSWAGASRGA